MKSNSIWTPKPNFIFSVIIITIEKQIGKLQNCFLFFYFMDFFLYLLFQKWKLKTLLYIYGELKIVEIYECVKA